ncbi:MAG: HAD family phosphatase [Candidatus Peribacteraceae bacterium]|jgi:HAD superfamily hydrolase (TIGR01549 family)
MRRKWSWLGKLAMTKAPMVQVSWFDYAHHDTFAMKYRALLFDLDGTLVNSIDLYGEAVIEAFRSIGIAVGKEHFREWYGRAMHFRDWIAEFGYTEDDVPLLRRSRDEHYIALLKEKVTWCKGAEEALNFLYGKIPLGLITGSWKSYTDAIDERLGDNRYFQTIITSDDMGKFMKPHPHGLLLAADRLKVKPEDCLYVGDQLFDVEAAQAAGMPCCIVHGKFTPDEAIQKADIVVKSMRELKAVAEL